MSGIKNPLPCPFCGEPPRVVPTSPEEEGDSWAQVECVNDDCPVYVCVDDGIKVADSRGSVEYKNAAIDRWNKRADR